MTKLNRKTFSFIFLLNLLMLYPKWLMQLSTSTIRTRPPIMMYGIYYFIKQCFFIQVLKNKVSTQNAINLYVKINDLLSIFFFWKVCIIPHNLIFTIPWFILRALINNLILHLYSSFIIFSLLIIKYSACQVKCEFPLKLCMLSKPRIIEYKRDGV